MNQFKKVISIVALIFSFFFANPLLAKDYKASLFGIVSDGITLNTRSIQFAIDYIHTNGGGSLVFYVGRYLTGSIHLESDVFIRLEEGAVLVGSLNPFDYDKDGVTALIFADNQQNIGITGKGVIDGRGDIVARNVLTNIQKGLIDDPSKNDRPYEYNRPMNIHFGGCSNVCIKGITLKNSASWNQTYDHCNNLTIDSITVENNVYWNEDGMDIVDCDDVKISNNYINTADDGICLKSQDFNRKCENISICNNVVRSSANGIKFGTASYGGFHNIRITNNIVYNTYRSALALEAVDGGTIDSIWVDSLRSIHTGNLIFLRTGERVAGKKSVLKNVYISNIEGDIPVSKPDSGYSYEGPVEDLPRNISPAIIIAGIPGSVISDVHIKNVKFTHPGGGDKEYANIPLQHLDRIPELASKYPDFSMFKELPAWGIFIRHATNVHLSSIEMDYKRPDDRMPVVLDDVNNSSFQDIAIRLSAKAIEIFQHQTQNVTIK